MPRFNKHRNERPAPRHQGPKTSWEGVSKWYGGYMGGKDTFQDAIVFPGALKLLGAGRGKRFLDIACGEGTFAGMIAKTGAEVVGLDAAPTLVRRAQGKKMRGTTFFVADATQFADKVEGPFDGASCILAIQNIEDIAAVLRDAVKVLKKGAPLVFVLNHPAFRIPRQSSWGWDEGKKMQFRRIDMYMTESEIPIQAHPGAAPSVKTFSYHRPLERYFVELMKAGFVVDGLEEWVSHRESESGPKARAENRARNEIPMFLALRARKK